jgi:hypothetical protein
VLAMIEQYLGVIKSLDPVIKQVLQLVRKGLIAAKPVPGDVDPAMVERAKKKAALLYPVPGSPKGRDLVDYLLTQPQMIGLVTPSVMTEVRQDASLNTVVSKINEEIKKAAASSVGKMLGSSVTALMEQKVKAFVDDAIKAVQERHQAQVKKVETDRAAYVAEESAKRLKIPANAAAVFSDAVIAKQVQEVLDRIDKTLHQLDVIDRFNTKLQDAIDKFKKVLAVLKKMQSDDNE